MHRKLLLYMLTLVLVVVMFIAAGLFFVGQFSTTTEKYSNNLTFQNEFYTSQIEKYFDGILRRPFDDDRNARKRFFGDNRQLSE